MQAFYADHFVLPLPQGHSFPMDKYARLRSRVAAECPALALTEALPASDGELALVHTPRYVSAVAEGHPSAAEQREIGFPWIGADGRAGAAVGRRDDRGGACRADRWPGKKGAATSSSGFPAGRRGRVRN